MNLQQQEQFYQMMTRLKSSRAASVQDDVRITEMINGVLVTRPAKKYRDYRSRSQNNW